MKTPHKCRHCYFKCRHYKYRNTYKQNNENTINNNIWTSWNLITPCFLFLVYRENKWKKNNNNNIRQILNTNYWISWNISKGRKRKSHFANSHLKFISQLLDFSTKKKQRAGKTAPKISISFPFLSLPFLSK